MSGHVALEADGVPTGTRQQWLDAAAGVLRKAGRLPDPPTTAVQARPTAFGATSATEARVLDALSSSTIEGVRVPAIGNVGSTGPAADRWPASRRATATTDGWDVRVPLADPDRSTARVALVADLEGGATSVWLTVGRSGTSAADLPFVLEPVLLDIAPVVLHVPAAEASDASTAWDAFAAVLVARGVTPAAGTSFGADPLGTALLTGTAADTSSVPEITRRAIDLGIGALVVDGTLAHNLGAGEAQELGWTLAAGVRYLRDLEAAGIDPGGAAQLMEFRYAVTDEQFVSIAKLRAARQLWARVLQLSGLASAGGPSGGSDAGQRQHAVTSQPMTTRYDPWVNMLRVTVAAFAAGVGGAQSVSVLPFDSAVGIPDAFGRRIARNVSHLLIGESHAAAVSDPAGGAPAVEELTSALAEAGWAEFRRIESSGGAAAALADGSFADRVAQVRASRDREIATRRIPLTGVSEFPQLVERLPNRRGRAADGYSWAAGYELLRDEPAARPVFLATIGPVAAHAARAGFATNALAAGGIAVVSAGPTSGADDMVAAYDPAVTPVVCLAGTDAGYAELAADIIAGLRAAGAGTVLLAGTPGPALNQLVDDHLTVGTDIPALCQRIREQLAGSVQTSDGVAR